jgi:hypothetical protein
VRALVHEPLGQLAQQPPTLLPLIGLTDYVPQTYRYS